MKQLPVRFESHQPERRRRSSTTLYGTCCCCTCCCLHAVGSLIGAAIAPSLGAGGRASLLHYEDSGPERAPALPPATGVKAVGSAIQSASRPTPLPVEEDEDRLSVMLPVSFSPSAVVLFWWIFAFLTFFSFSAGVLFRKTDEVDLLFQLVLVLPALQLASVFIVLFILLCSSRIDRPYQFKQLAKITLGTVLGTALGIFLMFVIGTLMT